MSENGIVLAVLAILVITGAYSLLTMPRRKDREIQENKRGTGLSIEADR